MITSSSRLRTVLVAVAVLAFAGINFAARPAPTAKPAAQTTAGVGDFALTDQNGARFQLREQRGRVVLLFFGYATCPDACPTMLAKLASVYKTLGAKKGRVLTVFVSVDPARDTPAALKMFPA